MKSGLAVVLMTGVVLVVMVVFVILVLTGALAVPVSEGMVP